MKTVFLRIGNWLLIIPIALIIIEKIFFAAYSFDIHLHDTYFVIANIYLGILIFILALIPFLCHLLLRTKITGNRNILLAHVVLTVLLLLFFYFYRFFIGSTTNQIKPRRYYDFSDWGSAEQGGGLNNYLLIAVFIFIVLQLSFMVYTIVKLIIKK
jgi:heme/copper-type cytochrome/quinol oxidase subunit 1